MRLGSPVRTLVAICLWLGLALPLCPDEIQQTASQTDKVDHSTLTGKVMVGYQGWFNCPDDGAGLGWTHWAKGRRGDFGPENVKVDLWPDMSQYPVESRYPTLLRHADGRVAEVFSSADAQTVDLHFRWMREYGIDGAFVQRFANSLTNPKGLRHKNAVLRHVQAAANREGRVYAIMYDLSGLDAGEVNTVLADWRTLRDTLRMTQDSAYLHHRGKPVVAVWGVGFDDNRRYRLAECQQLVEQLKEDGYCVLLGVPTGWRDLNRDAVDDVLLHQIIQQSDVICPWTVGRYRNPIEVDRHGRVSWQNDQAWCKEHGVEYMPTVFPGFSWHNMKPEAPLDQIPRLKGQFLWSQFVAAKKSGAEMVYVAMFDEVDEGTALFKCTNDPPQGQFLTYEGLPTDHYLWLTGEAARAMRSTDPMPVDLPQRQAVRKVP